MDGPFPADLVPAWERFFADPSRCRLDPVSGVCEAVFADGLLFPLQRRRELAKMLNAACTAGPPCDTCDGSGFQARADAKERQKALPPGVEAEEKMHGMPCRACRGGGHGPRVVMEIGADKGGGLLHWCLLPTVRLVIACEVRGTPYCNLFAGAFPHIDFVWMACGSENGSGLRLVLGDNRIDAAFLDGDKTRFVADFDAYLPLMSPGGLVFMHDVRDREPKRAFEAVRDRGYSCTEIFDASESVLAMDRAARGIPPASSYEGWLRDWAGKSAGVGVIRVGGKR